MILTTWHVPSRHQAKPADERSPHVVHKSTSRLDPISPTQLGVSDVQFSTKYQFAQTTDTSVKNKL